MGVRDEELEGGYDIHFCEAPSVAVLRAVGATCCRLLNLQHGEQQCCASTRLGIPTACSEPKT